MTNLSDSYSNNIFSDKGIKNAISSLTKIQLTIGIVAIITIISGAIYLLTPFGDIKSNIVSSWKVTQKQGTTSSGYFKFDKYDQFTFYNADGEKNGIAFYKVKDDKIELSDTVSSSQKIILTVDSNKSKQITGKMTDNETTIPFSLDRKDIPFSN